MSSDSFKKSLIEIFGNDSEIVKKMATNEGLSEIRLVGIMLWGLIATGKENKELCTWAGETMAQATVTLPEEDSPVLQQIRKLLLEGKSAEEVAEEFEENSKKVWPTYTRALVLSVAKMIDTNHKE